MGSSKKTDFGPGYHGPFDLNGKIYHCGSSLTMDYIGGKWKAVILWHLQHDTKRFAELHSLIPGMTERILSLQLKQMEADGIVNRKVYSKKPPLKVEYSLTEFGKSLAPLLEMISKWGIDVGLAKGKKP